MKKSLWMITVLVLVMALLAACGNSGSNSENTAEADEEKTGTAENNATTGEAAAGGETSEKKDITLTYLASQGWIKDVEMQLAKKYEEETGVKIDYQIVPADQYFNILKTKLNAKEGPDLFGGQSGYSEIAINYNVKENAVDLSDQEWVLREDPLTLEQLSLDGKVYALTIWDTYGSFVVTYNKKIFEELGIAIPKTYEEFKAACLKIQESGRTPIYEPVADGWHHVLWFAEPGPQYDKLTPNLYDDLNANKVNFTDNEPMLRSLSQLQEMYEMNFFGENTISDTGAETANKMASGEYAMSLAGQSIVFDIEKANPDLKATDFGYFVIPLADNQIYHVNPGGPSKSVYSGGKNIEEAKKYLAYLATPENLQYQLDNDPTVSNLNFPGLKDKYTEDQKKLFEMYPEKGTDLQDYVNYVNPQWMDIGKDLTAMFSGAMEPKDVLESIDKRRADMAKAAKDPAWE